MQAHAAMPVSFGKNGVYANARAKQVMVSTISRKSSKSWVWIALVLLAAIVVVYAWIDGGYRDVRLIEEPLEPVTVPAGDAA